MNICSYKKLPSLTANYIDDRFKVLFKEVCYIASIGIPGSGTVTSVAALTLGTTGTDLSSSVASGSTTPVITLNVPTASATNRGALSSADWSTFNGKVSSQWTTSSGNIYFNTGSVGINNASPNASAILDIASTTKGALLPRMTKVQRDAISSPATGLIIFQTHNIPGLRVYNGTNWIRYTETID